MKLFAITASLILGLALQSCSKDDSDSKSKEEKLTSGIWYFESYISDNINVSIEPCSFDNSLEFFTEGEWESDEGVEICPNSTQTSGGQWEFPNGNDMIEITQNGFTIPAEIIQLTETKFSLKTLDGITVKYTHQKD